MATLIKPDGTASQVAPVIGASFTLEELQGLVEGYIQIIRVGSAMYVLNEEGKLLGLPVNRLATHRAHDFLVYSDFLCGNVLICEPHEIE